MRICLLNSLYFPNQQGGAERSVQLLAEAMAGAGHDVRVICLGPESRDYVVNGVQVEMVRLGNIYWPFETKQHNVAKKAVWHLLDSFNAVMLSRCESVLRAHRVDLLHTNNLAGFSIAIWRLGRRLGVPIVHTLRDYYLLCPRTVMFRHGRPCPAQCARCRMFVTPRQVSSRWVNGVVGISRFVLEAHLGAEYFPGALQRVIHNPIELEKAGDPEFSSKSELVFGYLGRLDASKGVELVIDAARELREHHLKVLIAGVGDMPYRESLERMASGLPVQFLGHVAPTEFLRRIDVLVVPSVWHEPMGRVVIEAFAHGKPVIGAARGGIPELIDEGLTGFLFDPGKENNLAAKMSLFLDSQVVIEEMGPQCRRRAKAFSSDGIRSEYERFFREVVERYRTRKTEI